MQGGLEIPVQVTAEMDLTERDKAILEKDCRFKSQRTKEVLKGLEDG